MNSTAVQKIARVLNVLVLVTFICNLLALPLVPCLVFNRFRLDMDMVARIFAYDFDDGLAIFFDTPYYQVWQQPYTFVLTIFLWVCGICTAIILWQGRRVLGSILRGEPFSMENGTSLRKAAGCGFIISAAALVRVIFSICFYHSIYPLLTYNALFVPIFAMFGLLCLVMSALFRQAADMKADADLTI